MNNLSIQERIDLIMSIGEEVVGADELRGLLESDQELITYDGFEPSGQMHIAQGIVRAINVNKMIKAGFKFKMLVADWFAYLNNKMEGDLEKIKKLHVVPAVNEHDVVSPIDSIRWRLLPSDLS